MGATQCSITVCNYLSTGAPTNFKPLDEKDCNVKCDEVGCTRPINVDKKNIAFFTDIVTDKPGVRHLRNKDNIMHDVIDSSENPVDKQMKEGSVAVYPDAPGEYKGNLPKTYEEAVGEKAANKKIPGLKPP